MRRVVVGLLAVGVLGSMGGGVANAVGDPYYHPNSSESWTWHVNGQKFSSWQDGSGSTTSSTTTSSTTSTTTSTSGRSGDGGQGGQGGSAQGGSSHSFVEGDGWAESFAQGESVQGSHG